MNRKWILLSWIILFLFSAPGMADLSSMKARVPKIVEMKTRGAIGEQPDGYLGVVKDEAGAKALVDEENADRRQEYSRRAAEQGQAVDVLGKVLGEARVRQEKAGRFVRQEDGSWIKKE